MPKTSASIQQNLIFGLFVIISGLLSLGLVVSSEIVPPIWMATGTAAFAFWSCGPRVAPGVLLGMATVFAINAWARGDAGGDLATLLSLIPIPALIATVYPLVGARLLKGVWKNKDRFPTRSKRILIGASIVAPLAALFATLDVVMTSVAPAEHQLRSWFIIFAGNLAGLLIFFPVCLQLVRGPGRAGTEKVASYSNYMLILAILVMSLGSTYFVWSSINGTIQKYYQSRFDALTLESSDTLEFRLASYEHALQGANGLLYASTHVDRREWGIYVEAAKIRDRFPGINGIGYIANVADQDMQAFIEAARQDGMPDFAEKPAGEHAANYIIVYIEPVDINLAAVGLNIAFEDNRRQAAMTSMDTGQSTITKRILLVQDAERTPGFLLLLPHYKQGAPLDTVAQRRAATLGWVYAPFIAKNFLHDLTSSQGDTLNLRIYDGVEMDPEFLIFDSETNQAEQTAEAPHFTSTRQLTVMGQSWTLVWTSTSKFDDKSINPAAHIVALGGIILTSLLTFTFVLIIRRNQKVRLEVDRQTKTIAQANSRLQAVLDTVVDGIVTISPQGIIRTFNPAAERIFGYQAHEVVDKNVKVLMPEPYHSEHDGYLVNHRSTGIHKVIGSDRNVTAQRKDGTHFPMELAVNEIDSGTGSGFVGSIRDITERHEAVTALKASETTFRQTMEQASIGMALIALDGTWMRVNHAFCDLLGVERSYLLNRNASELTHPDDIAAETKWLNELLADTEVSCRFEKRLIAQSRDCIWVQVSVSLVRKPNGAPDYFIAHFEDISQRREMDRIKSEFVSTVSHELRTPLTSIRGSLGLVVGTMAEDLPEKLNRLVTVAHQNTERLIRLVNDILDIDKLESGNMRIEMQTESIADIVSRVVEANTSFAASHGVSLKMDPLDPSWTVTVDPLRLEQVFANLISNAAKFSHTGGEVNVHAERTNDVIRISIRDQGIGISDDFKNRIFTKFAQADGSATRKKGGTGLGLSISKQLVEQMSGHIGFDTHDGEGSTFWVEFPLSASPVPERQNVQSERVRHEA